MGLKCDEWVNLFEGSIYGNSQINLKSGNCQVNFISKILGTRFHLFLGPGAVTFQKVHGSRS